MNLKYLKSQVTMLMIIGLVMFIVVGLVLYLSKSAVKHRSQQNIKRISDNPLEVQPIKQLVANCLDKLTKESVELLGRQGGYIYFSQGGTLIDYDDNDEGLFFIKNNGNNVAYNIIPPKFTIGPYSSEIPDYPWVTFPHNISNPDAETFEGYFGISNLPPLNASEGPNSIKFQMETFIDNNLANCIDLNVFKERGLDINIENPKTSVVIGSSDIGVKSTIPITITNPGTNEIYELNDFSTNLGVRLNDIYFFAKEIIDNDIRNIKFNISDSKNSKNSLSVKLIENAFSSDDLVVITDTKSIINGRFFEYSFGRKNRAPAMHYLKNSLLQFENGHYITKEELLSNQELKAEDPDEDSLKFTIKIGENEAVFPKKLEAPKIDFKIEVTDEKLIDYQIITVNKTN